MKIVVGLGNPGREYERTLHNVGFAVVDELAGRLACSLRKSLRFEARLGKAVVGEETVWLVQPVTFMNRSGEAVASILRYRPAEIADVIVVVDDADLERGRLRIRAGGGSGGHKGLGSIIDAVGNRDFPRVRLGIGRMAGTLTEQVLRPLPPEEWPVMDTAVKRAAEAVLCMIESGVETAMNRFNAPAPETEKETKSGEPN